MARSVKEDQSHLLKSIVLLVVLFGGYMVYTGIYDPIRAAEHLFDTVLRFLPGPISRVLRQVFGLFSGVIDAVLDLINQIIRELRRAIG